MVEAGRSTGAICPSELRVPRKQLEDRFLGAIEKVVFRPDHIEFLVDRSCSGCARSSRPTVGSENVPGFDQLAARSRTW